MHESNKSHKTPHPPLDRVYQVPLLSPRRPRPFIRPRKRWPHRRWLPDYLQRAAKQPVEIRGQCFVLRNHLLGRCPSDYLAINSSSLHRRRLLRCPGDHLRPVPANKMRRCVGIELANRREDHVAHHRVTELGDEDGKAGGAGRVIPPRNALRENLPAEPGEVGRLAAAPQASGLALGGLFPGQNCVPRGKGAKSQAPAAGDSSQVTENTEQKSGAKLQFNSPVFAKLNSESPNVPGFARNQKGEVNKKFFHHPIGSLFALNAFRINETIKKPW